jgi:hypothetical protein
MSATNPTYSPVSRLAIEATEDIPAFRFVSHLGSVCGDGLLAAGISEEAFADGEKITVIDLGTALLELKAQIAKGDQLASDADGFGVKATTNDFVNAISMSAGVTGTNIEVHLLNFKI